LLDVDPEPDSRTIVKRWSEGKVLTIPKIVVEGLPTGKNVTSPSKS
jgi:hypothetical protein